MCARQGAAEGYHGVRFNPRKADLHAFRETFAHELRARGVECEATPRRARGIIRKADCSAIRHIELRAERRPASRGGETIRQRRRTLDEASRIVRGRKPEYRLQDDQAMRRQRQVRDAYEQAARALEGTGLAGDRVLASKVRAFVAGMPLPLSHRLSLAIELGQRDQQATGPGENAARSRGQNGTDLRSRSNGRPNDGPERDS